MKKLALIVLAVFYLGISSGAAVHLHYCMGQLVEWSLGAKTATEKCSKCGMKANTSKDCCKNEQKQLKFQSEQKISQLSLQLKAPHIVLINTPFQTENALFDTNLVEEFPVSNGPPKVPDTPVFLRNCNFRI